MAKGALIKAAQRLVSSPLNRQVQRYQLPGNVIRTSTTDQTASQTGHSLWMKATPESFLGKEPDLSAIGNLEDDEDIKRELMPNSSIETHPIRKLDTHAMVKGLIEGGFTLSQAEAITMTIVGTVDETSNSLRTSMVSKPQAELTIQKVASQLAILRRDLMIMEKTDFTELITKMERIEHELQQLQRTTKDEISKISSDMTLDFNLEKGKVKDMHLDHLKVVDDKHSRIFEMLAKVDKELQNIKSYIDKENATLQTIFERYKSDTIKLAFGSVATCMTIVLGFYRLWS